MGGTVKAAKSLEGKWVSLAGRLASMSKAEAARLVESHGGILATRLSRTPAVVIVGRDGWPLGPDGRPSAKLRKAQWMADHGYDVEIVPEEELLARLHRHGARWQRHATLRELAGMLDTSLQRLNGWLRAGLIEPVKTIDGLRYFDFCQVAGAKSLCDLVRRGITTERLGRSLRQLRRWLRDIEHPLAQLTALEQGRQLLVRLESGRLAEPTGQLLLEFCGQSSDQHPPSLPWVAEVRTAEQWFELACDAEDRGDWPEAARGYRQALLAGGPAAQPCFNLANALYALGQYARAGERYRQVLELDPGYWEAWNNLGTVLTLENQYDDALAAFRQALRLNPDFADAHYNIADTLEEMHRPDEASEHWQRYLDLEPSGPWADHARSRLCQPDWC